MAYSRWSTIVPEKLAYSLDKINRIMKDEAVSFETVRLRELEEATKQGGVQSRWYVYWHCNSGTTRDEQLLNIMNTACRMDEQTLYTFPEVCRFIANSATMREIPGFDDTPKVDNENLAQCMHEWVNDVKSEFRENGERKSPPSVDVMGVATGGGE